MAVSISLRSKSFKREKQKALYHHQSELTAKILRSGVVANAFIEPHDVFKVVNPDLKPSWLKSQFRSENGISTPKEVLNYSEVLKMIRTQRIAEIRWPDSHMGCPHEPEGPCLLVFWDGQTKLCYIPFQDKRLWYALSNHGVGTGVLKLQTKNIEFLSLNDSVMVRHIRTLAPAVCIGLIYGLTQFVADQKGDVKDRKKLRKQKIKDRKKNEKDIRNIQIIQSAYEMANSGKSAHQIESMLKSYGVEIGHIESEIIASSRDRETPNNVTTTENTSHLSTQTKSTKADSRHGSNKKEPQKTTSDKLSNNSLGKLNHPKKSGSIEKQLKMRELKSKLKLQYIDEDRKIRFDDVAGIDDTRYELEELVTFLNEPTRFRNSGAKIPRGVLMCGKPGTGKTLLARAVAGESGASFLSVNASEFVEMFVGVGAARVRNLFTQAKQVAPAIIFIDEIDAIGRSRGSGSSGGTDERDQTLNQLLSLMDGFDDDSCVIVMAATNRKDILDPALVRPGRFDRVISINPPDLRGREAILRVHLKDQMVEPDINLRDIAHECQGLVGAHLASLVNASAMYASRAGRQKISNNDMLATFEYERLGPVHTNPPHPELEKRISLSVAATALTAYLLPHIEDVLTVTIIPREKLLLGNTIFKFDENRLNHFQFSRNQLENQLVVELAAIAAEKIFRKKNDVSYIAQERIANARRIATTLVIEADMSDGPLLTYSRSTPSLSKIYTRNVQKIRNHVSDESLYKGHNNQQNKINEATRKASALLIRNRLALNELAKELYVRKELSSSELQLLLGKTVDKLDLMKKRRNGDYDYRIDFS
eukprot:gnl/TRDRNA2_/TRDRNA2_177427_c0_seq1.p1 gnl/TRDRNA2_/TRDRNA2_177427_c0~~gnl/TRDRNA2_/TRDRNA2_177427_c0_seq1.p1  ORF type:complete len:820 (+),score=-33.75 gnl/TRDRNA2_/TRDRNA2_177427_c0_seq1:97-2556(+)